MRLVSGGRNPLPAATDRCWLVIPAQQKTTTFWEVTRTKISEVDRLPSHAWPVLSLAEDDLRLAVAKPCSNKQARSLIRRDSGQMARIINQSNLGMVYGRPVTAMPADYAVAPATLLIDQMLLDRGWPAEPFIACLLLSVEGSHNEILALWAGNFKRDLSAVQVTENAQQVEQIIDAFCARHSIDSDREGSLLVLDLEAIFAALAKHGKWLRPYPDFDDWHGVPVQTVWTGVAVAAGVAAVAAAGIVGALWIKGHALDSGYAEALAKTAAAQQRVVQLFERNLVTVAERASVDYRGLVQTAAAAYASGGVASVHAEGAFNRVRYTLPIEPSAGAASEVATIDTTRYALFQAARARAVNGAKPVVLLGGAGNELYYDYQFAAGNRRLLDYLDRKLASDPAARSAQR